MPARGCPTQYAETARGRQELKYVGKRLSSRMHGAAMTHLSARMRIDLENCQPESHSIRYPFLSLLRWDVK